MYIIPRRETLRPIGLHSCIASEAMSAARFEPAEPDSRLPSGVSLRLTTPYSSYPILTNPNKTQTLTANWSDVGPPHCIRLVIEYLYNGTYSHNNPAPHNPLLVTKALEMHFAVAIIANKKKVKGLALLAVRKIARLLHRQRYHYHPIVLGWADRLTLLFKLYPQGEVRALLDSYFQVVSYWDNCSVIDPELFEEWERWRLRACFAHRNIRSLYELYFGCIEPWEPPPLRSKDGLSVRGSITQQDHLSDEG
jgi:hypothetical protein